MGLTKATWQIFHLMTAFSHLAATSSQDGGVLILHSAFFSKILIPFTGKITKKSWKYSSHIYACILKTAIGIVWFLFSLSLPSNVTFLFWLRRLRKSRVQWAKHPLKSCNSSTHLPRLGVHFLISAINKISCGLQMSLWNIHFLKRKIILKEIRGKPLALNIAFQLRIFPFHKNPVFLKAHRLSLVGKSQRAHKNVFLQVYSWDKIKLDGFP